MTFRNYDPTKDKDAVHRILREVGWLEKGKEEVLDASIESARAMVAELNGEPECIVTTAPGTMRYLDEELPLVEVTMVATSHIARRQGLAKRLLARALADDVADGSIVARVCAFDQGFYDNVGFGMGGYEHTLSFDPATLKVNVRPRLPRRLGADDLKLIHASRLGRRRGHGGMNYASDAITAVELGYHLDNHFGLGYCDGPNGELTHHFYGRGSGERGPYYLHWLAFRTTEQFLELMGLIKSLADQVRLVRLREPAGIQLQDLLDRPFKHQEITERSKFENRISSCAFWQLRICDLPACLARTHLPWGQVRFNLRLTDPAAGLLGEHVPWPGIGGEYMVTLGGQSSCEPGTDPSLPTLTASVNAFSRLWLGVRPATGIAATDQLSGPPSLLDELDRVLRLPQPKPDWDF
jgi:predicted acetyltransferase